MAESNEWQVVTVTKHNASIENEEGVHVAGISRHFDPGRVNPDKPFRSTDEQWQAIIDCIAAAPEMLATLKDLRRDIRAGSILDAGNIEAWGKYIDEVLAKAEPPRKVKVRLTFEVEVEKQENDYLTIARARNEVLVTGAGREVRQEIVEGGVTVRCDGVLVG